MTPDPERSPRPPSSDGPRARSGKDRAVSNGSALEVMLATFTGQAAVSFGLVAVDLLAPALAERTGLNQRDFSLGNSFIFVGVILVSPHLAGLMTRFGSARLMAAATAGMSVGMLAILHGSWWATMLACAIFGLCYGIYSPASASVVASRAPSTRRALFMSVRQCGVPFAGAIAGRVLPWIVLAWGWRAGASTVAAVVAAGAVLTFLLPEAFRIGVAEAGRSGASAGGDSEPTSPASASAPGSSPEARAAVASGGVRSLPGQAVSPGPWRTLLGRYRLPPTMRAPVAAAIALAVSQIALSSFAYFYLLEVVGVTTVQAGVYLSNTLIASVVGRLVVGWLSDRIGSAMRALLSIQLVSAATCLVLPSMSAATPDWALLLVAIASGVSTGSWSPIFMTAVSNLAPPGRMADFNGRAFSYAALGWCLAAPLVWAGIELTGGYAPVWYALGALNLVLAWRAGLFRPRAG